MVNMLRTIENYFEVFDAIDEVSSEGLEAMLQKIVEVKSKEGDYSTVGEVKTLIERGKLGIPVDAEIQDIVIEKYEQLKSAEREFMEEALRMYIQDGSLKSINSAESLAINLENYELALDLRIERGQIKRGFEIFEYMESRKDLMDDAQKWREHIIKDAYGPVAENLKANIEGYIGRETQCETIDELLANNKIDYMLAGEDVRRYIKESIKCAMNSDVPEILKIGIESNSIKARSEEEHRDVYIKNTEMFLRGKLTGDEKYTQYFIEHAEEKQKEGKDDMAESYATWAIKLLKSQDKGNDALKVAEKYLSSTSSQRIELLEDCGNLSDPDTLRLITDHYKMGSKPIDYALALAKAGESA